jgi:hypothetical protein
VESGWGPPVPDHATPDIVEFVKDPQLLGLSVSPAQETLLRAIYGLSMPRTSSSSIAAARLARSPPARHLGR